MMRAGTLALLLAWAWGAGAVYAVGEARLVYCQIDEPTAGLVTSFGWPIAAMALTLEGEWGSRHEGCPTPSAESASVARGETTYE